MTDDLGQRRLLRFTSVSMIVLAGVMTGLSTTSLEIANYFGVSNTRAGALYSLHFGGFLVFVLLSSLIPVAGGRTKVLTVTAAIYASALILAGLARSLPVMAISLVVAGGAGGTLESQTATMQAFASRHEGGGATLISVAQAFFSISALVIPALLILVPRDLSSWRVLFLALSLVAVIAFFLSLLLRPVRCILAKPGARTTSTAKLLVSCAAMALYVGAEVTLFGWAAVVMELFYAVPAERARLAPSLFWAGMFTGRMLVSWLAQLVPSQRLLSYSAAVAITGTILFVLATRESLLWIAIAVAALGCAGIWPLLVSDGALHGSSRAPAFIVAAGGLGAATFPYLAGLVGALLGGRLIPALAIPLLVGVFVLVRAERNGSQERMV